MTSYARVIAIALSLLIPLAGQGQVTSLADLEPTRGLAMLPSAVPPLPRQLAAKACTRALKDGANLQGAIDKARAGDVLCLEPGGRFVGNFTLPRRGDTGWVVLRTDPAAGAIADPGSRVRPSLSGPLAKLIARGTELSGSAIRAAPGARGWYLTLLEVTTDSMRPTGPTALITLGGGEARGAEGQPTDLVLDRVYAHGWSRQTLRRCVALNSGATAIVDSWLDECHEKGADSQAIAGWGGTGPYLIENNTLAGAGENVMFGGADPTTPGLTPSDVILRRNHIVTPIEWKGRWTKKNLVETKNVRRFLIEGNVMDGSWADGQDGWAIVLKSANQSGRCTWCITSDVTIRHNLIRNVGAGIAVNGRGGDRRNIDSLSRRIEITENYVENVAVAPYNGVARLIMLLSGTEGLIIAQNTFLSPSNGSLSASVILGSPKVVTAEGLVFERNVLTRGRYLLVGCGGPRGFSSCLPGARLQGNIVVGPSKPADAQLAGFSPSQSINGALARAGVSRASVERATAGVVVAR